MAKMLAFSGGSSGRSAGAGRGARFRSRARAWFASRSTRAASATPTGPSSCQRGDFVACASGQVTGATSDGGCHDQSRLATGRPERERKMAIHTFAGERVTLTTSRKFSDVVAHIEGALGRPNIGELFQKIRAAQTPQEVNQVVAAAAGPLRLMELMRLDLGMILRKDE